MDKAEQKSQKNQSLSTPRFRNNNSHSFSYKNNNFRKRHLSFESGNEDDGDLFSPNKSTYSEGGRSHSWNHKRQRYNNHNFNNYNNNLRNLQQRISDLEEKIDQKDGLIRDVEFNVLTRDQDITDLKIKHEREILEIEKNYSRKLKDIQQKENECDDQIRQLKLILENKREIITKLRADLEDAQRDLHATRVVLECVNTRNIELSAKLNEKKSVCNKRVQTEPILVSIETPPKSSHYPLKLIKKNENLESAVESESHLNRSSNLLKLVYRNNQQKLKINIDGTKSDDYVMVDYIESPDDMPHGCMIEKCVETTNDKSSCESNEHDLQENLHADSDKQTFKFPDKVDEQKNEDFLINFNESLKKASLTSPSLDEIQRLLSDTSEPQNLSGSLENLSISSELQDILNLSSEIDTTIGDEQNQENCIISDEKFQELAIKTKEKFLQKRKTLQLSIEKCYQSEDIEQQLDECQTTDSLHENDKSTEHEKEFYIRVHDVDIESCDDIHANSESLDSGRDNTKTNMSDNDDACRGVNESTKNESEEANGAEDPSNNPQDIIVDETQIKQNDISEMIHNCDDSNVALNLTLHTKGLESCAENESRIYENPLGLLVKAAELVTNNSAKCLEDHQKTVDDVMYGPDTLEIDYVEEIQSRECEKEVIEPLPTNPTLDNKSITTSIITDGHVENAVKNIKAKSQGETSEDSHKRQHCNKKGNASKKSSKCLAGQDENREEKSSKRPFKIMKRRESILKCPKRDLQQKIGMNILCSLNARRKMIRNELSMGVVSRIVQSSLHAREKSRSSEEPKCDKNQLLERSFSHQPLAAKSPKYTRFNSYQEQQLTVDENAQQRQQNKNEISQIVKTELTVFYDLKKFESDDPKELFKGMARAITYHFFEKKPDALPNRNEIKNYIMEVFYNYGTIKSEKQFLLAENYEF